MKNIFRDRATIEQDSSAGDTAVPDYSGTPFLVDYPCRITTIGGDETYRGRMLEAHLTHVVEGHYYEGITPSMRLNVTGGRHTGNYLNIVYTKLVEQPGLPPMWELQCRENVGR